MTARTFTIEQYLSRIQLEILELRQVVAGLYQAGTSKQSSLFIHYETVLDHKCNEYRQLRQALAKQVA